jgi:tripeptidyl-peptidase-1
VLTKEESPFSVLAVNATCNTRVTPDCLSELYKFKSYAASTAVNATIGVSGFLEQYFRYADYSRFLQRFAPKAATEITFVSVNGRYFCSRIPPRHTDSFVGGLNDQNSAVSSTEANLDIQYTAGILPPSIKTTYYSTPGRGLLVPDLDQPNPEDNQNEPYLDYFTYLVGLDDKELPQVLTTSYGEDEQSVPPEYARKVCDMIGQLGTRGVSVLFCKFLHADSVAWMASGALLTPSGSQRPQIHY